MEDNFKESNMKLTKETIINKYATAITTIESKDSEINNLNGEIEKLSEQLLEAKKEIKNYKSNDFEGMRKENIGLKTEIEALRKELGSLKGVNYEALHKQHEELKQQFNFLASSYNQLIEDHQAVINMNENHLKVIQTVNENQIGIHMRLKKEVEQKYGVPKNAQAQPGGK